MRCSQTGLYYNTNNTTIPIIEPVLPLSRDDFMISGKQDGVHVFVTASATTKFTSCVDHNKGGQPADETPTLGR